MPPPMPPSVEGRSTGDARRTADEVGAAVDADPAGAGVGTPTCGCTIRSSFLRRPLPRGDRVTHPSPPFASAPIAWVRAAFLGALSGALLWAIVWKLFAVFGADTATALWIVGPIAIVWVPVPARAQLPTGSVHHRVATPT